VVVVGDTRGGGVNATAESTIARTPLRRTHRSIGAELDTLTHCSILRSTKGRFMKKTSRIEMARDIVAYVRKEMDRPRLTESVRSLRSGTDTPAFEKPSSISAQE